MSAAIENPPTTYQAPTDELKRLCRADYAAGRGWSTDLARKYNLNPTTVKGWVIDGGWVKLRNRRDQAELSKLEIGLPPEAPMPEHRPSDIEILKNHLRTTDELLESCTDARDRAQLTRARGELAEQLWVAEHGAKPGTQRPARATKRTMAPVQPLGEAE